MKDSFRKEETEGIILKQKGKGTWKIQDLTPYPLSRGRGG